MLILVLTLTNKNSDNKNFIIQLFNLSKIIILELM